MACPLGWQPAPPGGEYSARCYKSVEWATSLRECVKHCIPAERLPLRVDDLSA